MYALKRELKLNNAETAQMRGNAGFKRWAYNFGLKTIQASWDLECIKASDSKRIDAIKKVFTQVIMQETGNAWMKKYPSTIYQSVFIALKDAFAKWRKGLTSFPKKKTKKKGDSLTVYKTSGIYPTVGQPALPLTNRVTFYAGQQITAYSIYMRYTQSAL